MIIEAFRPELIPQVRQLMALGEPYIRVRTDSDYWLYAQLFSSTCPIALAGWPGGRSGHRVPQPR